MSVTAIVGASWGDEGKGRMVDALASTGDHIVRFQGGGNAGHTVITDRGKFVLRLLPSGVLRPGTINVIGPGVAVDLDLLATELEGLRASGVVPVLRISDRAQVVLPHQRLLDALDEQRLGSDAIGSTGCGIGPHQADRHARRGLSIDDLRAADLPGRLARLLWPSNVLLTEGYGRSAVDPHLVASELAGRGAGVAAAVCDTTELLTAARRAGRGVLLEGQLGALRDVVHGIYPHVTSSSTLAGYAATGAGIPPWAITRVVAVTKAYSSCVGAGPFVTELAGAAAEELRRRGGDAGEYGAHSGRPRRVGHFDAVATRHGCALQGATEVALTCLDVLGYLDEIPICTAYEVAGNRITRFPTPRHLGAATAVCETLPGWRTSLREVSRCADLPRAARAYVDRIEELLEVPIRWISISPHRDGLLMR